MTLAVKLATVTGPYFHSMAYWMYFSLWYLWSKNNQKLPCTLTWVMIFLTKCLVCCETLPLSMVLIGFWQKNEISWWLESCVVTRFEYICEDLMVFETDFQTVRLLCFPLQESLDKSNIPIQSKPIGDLKSFSAVPWTILNKVFILYVWTHNASVLEEN